MVFVESLGQQETAEKFAHLWFAGMAKFHRVKDPSSWDFDEQHVIAFLRSKLSTKMPTWKRLKIIEGVIWYRNHVRKSATPRLEPIRTKLREMIAQERQSQDEEPIEDVVGKINPREPDVIQVLRRTLRLGERQFPIYREGEAPAEPKPSSAGASLSH